METKEPGSIRFVLTDGEYTYCGGDKRHLVTGYFYNLCNTALALAYAGHHLEVILRIRPDMEALDWSPERWENE